MNQRHQEKTRVTLTGTNADTLYVAPMLDAEDYFLAKAYALPHDTLAADNANYATVEIRDGSTVLGSLSSQSTAFTAGQAREFSLSGAGRKVTGGQIGADTDPLNINVTKTGTGGAIDADVILVWEKLR